MAENEAKETKEFNARKWIIWTIIISALIVVAAAIGLYALYSNDDSGRSLGEYIGHGIAILAAVVSGCISAISMINGKKNNEEQQKREDALRKEQCEREDRLLQHQKDFEEKWNQKKIDADLKARARIEWIQRVREATSGFYSSCNDLLKVTSLAKRNDEIDEKYIRELLLNTRQMGAILILYFGPETDIDKERELDATDDNKGKNDKIVALIKDILEVNESLQAVKYTTMVATESLKYESNMLFNEIPLKINTISDDASLHDLDTDSDEFKNYCEKNNQYREIVREFCSELESKRENLQKLIDAIRIYLKIEWDRAKNNED